MLRMSFDQETQIVTGSCDQQDRIYTFMFTRSRKEVMFVLLASANMQPPTIVVVIPSTTLTRAATGAILVFSCIEQQEMRRKHREIVV